MPTTKLDVVIPAGGLIDGDYAAAAGTSIRALAPVGADKKPVVQVVVDALRASGRVGRIVVAGLPGAMPAALGGHVLLVPESSPEGLEGISGGPANILAGLREVDADRIALVCTSDLPFLTPEAVVEFIDRINVDVDVDIAGGIVSARSYNQRFADAPPSEFVNLVDEGPSTLACLFAVRPSVILGKMGLVSSVFEARKSQWGMVRLLGLKLLCEFATKRLSAESIRRRLEQLLDCRIDLVDEAPAEAAFDVDTLEDYLYSCKQ